MARNPLHDVAIVGAYNTVQARRIDEMTEIELVLDAARGAITSAGMTFDDVDGYNIRSSVSRVSSRESVNWLGGRMSWCGVDLGIGAVLEAAGAIAQGQCQTVVIADAQSGQYTDRAKTAPWTRPTNEFVECWGLYTTAEFALIAQRHMHQYGTKPEQLAEVAAAIRSNGAINPEAVYHGRPCAPQDVLDSRMVADPFHLLDCCTASEGGAGLVLTHADRARDLDVTPVWLLGGALDRMGMSYVTAPIYEKYGMVGQRGGRICFDQAGLKPENVDVCEFYDPFSFEIIRQFEALGFCKEGEGGDFVMDGRIRIDGRFPIVTNGGLMSYSHAGTAQLLQKPIAAALQLRNEVPDALNVPDAKVAMTTNGGAGALFLDMMIMGTERP